LVSDIPAGDGKNDNIFLQCIGENAIFVFSGYQNFHTKNCQNFCKVLLNAAKKLVLAKDNNLSFEEMFKMFEFLCEIIARKK
jgi:hypothetical protein